MIQTNKQQSRRITNQVTDQAPPDKTRYVFFAAVPASVRARTPPRGSDRVMTHKYGLVPKKFPAYSRKKDGFTRELLPAEQQDRVCFQVVQAAAFFSLKPMVQTFPISATSLPASISSSPPLAN